MNEEDLPEDLNIESDDEETELRIQDEQKIESTMRNVTEINVMNMTEISNDQQQQSAEPSIGRNMTNVTEILNDQQQQPAELTIRRNMTNMIEIFNDQRQQPAKLTIERNVTDMTEIPKRKTKKITNLQLQQQIENTIEKKILSDKQRKLATQEALVLTSITLIILQLQFQYDSDECNTLRNIINLPTDHHQIDRSSTDRKLLICKVIGIVDDELYKLGCKSGILNICYNVVELIPTRATDFSELQEIPNTLISLCETSLCQSWGEMTDYQYNCRGSCKTNHCNCKKAEVLCGAWCHDDGSSICENQRE
ncbi:8773_t:CDS:2 [Ambispora gerdemannii]|uniref:8773_t:CDS:1 n=1 Tax=Ambispora gerdemannii TaxID=144530 RepID=A0A9N9B4A0_9GLOM|nr:8773_t:CDS:2 [Ambispora gerdemannii]